MAAENVKLAARSTLSEIRYLYYYRTKILSLKLVWLAKEFYAGALDHVLRAYNLNKLSGEKNIVSKLDKHGLV